jgi:hypothetical protein
MSVGNKPDLTSLSKYEEGWKKEIYLWFKEHPFNEECVPMGFIMHMNLAIADVSLGEDNYDIKRPMKKGLFVPEDVEYITMKELGLWTIPMAELFDKCGLYHPIDQELIQNIDMVKKIMCER